MYPYRHISSQDSSFRIRSTQGADFRLCADFSGLTQFCCQFFDSCFNTSFDAGSSRCSEYYDDHDYDRRNDNHTVFFQKCFHWTFTSLFICPLTAGIKPISSIQKMPPFWLFALIRSLAKLVQYVAFQWLKLMLFFDMKLILFWINFDE